MYRVCFLPEGEGIGIAAEELGQAEAVLAVLEGAVLADLAVEEAVAAEPAAAGRRWILWEKDV